MISDLITLREQLLVELDRHAEPAYRELVHRRYNDKMERREVMSRTAYRYALEKLPDDLRRAATQG